MARRRTSRASLVLAVLTLAAALGSGTVGAGAAPRRAAASSPILAGAATVSITPFTLTPELRACRADRRCPYHAILARSNPAASNPDGLPGGLFERIGEEMAGSASAEEWIGPTGVWGEPYTDANGNGAYDAGEAFTDDPANSSPLPGPGSPYPLGDPLSSTNKWDGVYLGGYGTRVALGAFDPITVRALYLKDRRTGTSLAWLSLDLTGYFSDFLPRVRERVSDEAQPGEIILSHTHDHEAPDTVGLWGPEVPEVGLPTDGTYPRYERYIEAKMAQAVELAATRLTPARFKFGSTSGTERYRTPRGNLETLAGMQSRNSCRTPWFFDAEVRAMQVVADRGARTIATVMNWGTHVESMDAGNLYVSSDYPHAARTLVEGRLGGTALFLPGAQGAVEIIGDSCTRKWRRDTFDGERYPLTKDGDPKVFEPHDQIGARNRAYAIGRVVGAAALAAVGGEPLEPRAPKFELLGPSLLCYPVNNAGLGALGAAGVIDKPFNDPACPPGLGNLRAKTALYALRIGSGSFITVPGELAPELYHGVSRVNRASGIGDYVRANPEALRCAARGHHDSPPGAHTGRPYEPDIRAAQAKRFGRGVHFVVGYTPDLLGYIVPGYDFFWFGGGEAGVPLEEAPDPCAEHPPDLGARDALYRTHYQETNSAGSMLAPAVACELVRLLGDPLGQGDSDACAEWDVTNLLGRPPLEPPAPGREPGCPQDPNACQLRHY